MKTRAVKASGEVVHMRVSSEDIMAAIDIIDVSGLNTQAWSLAMVVKWAMSFAFEACRASGSIPRRSGYEYSQMVGRYVRGHTNAVNSAKNVMSRELIINEIKGGMKAQDIGLFRPEVLETSPTDDTFMGITVPDEVRYLVPCGQRDLNVINMRIINRDPNVSATEVAKWLLYAENRSLGASILEPSLVLEAEAMIKQVWPEYPSVL